jgi:hypothetical protein
LQLVVAEKMEAQMLRLVPVWQTRLDAWRLNHSRLTVTLTAVVIRRFCRVPADTLQFLL